MEDFLEDFMEQYDIEGDIYYRNGDITKICIEQKVYKG